MKAKLILSGLLLCGAAHAEFLSANRLLSYLDGEAFERGYAMGYIIGVHDFGDKTLNCAPNGVTAGQIRDMVHQHLRANPDTRHFSADSIVSNFLSKTWPCPRRNSNSGKAL